MIGYTLFELVVQYLLAASFWLVVAMGPVGVAVGCIGGWYDTWHERLSGALSIGALGLFGAVMLVSTTVPCRGSWMCYLLPWAPS